MSLVMQCTCGIVPCVRRVVKMERKASSGFSGYEQECANKRA